MQLGDPEHENNIKSTARDKKNRMSLIMSKPEKTDNKRQREICEIIDTAIGTTQTKCKGPDSGQNQWSTGQLQVS